MALADVKIKADANRLFLNIYRALGKYYDWIIERHSDEVSLKSKQFQCGRPDQVIPVFLPTSTPMKKCEHLPG